jgi:hypothetical protein
MTPATRSLALLVALALASHACSGSGSGDDDDDGATSPTPTATDAPSKMFTLNGSGFQVAHVGETALVRVFRAQPAPATTPPLEDVVFCGESDAITGGGVFSVSSVPAAVLATNGDYTVELFANVSGGTAVLNTGANPDHLYTIASSELENVQDDVVIDFPHGVQTPQSEFTWAPGTGCPGVP